MGTTRHYSIISFTLSLRTMADDIVLPIPNLTLPQDLFVLSNASFKDRHEASRTSLLEGIQADRALRLSRF